MGKTTFLIAWYFPSLHGGAEKSILEVLKKYKKENLNIKVISFDEEYKKGPFTIEGISGYNYGLKFNFSSLSRYITFFLNTSFMSSILKKHGDEIKAAEFVISQSINAPLVGVFCKKNHVNFHYYLRNEQDLSIFKNYELGLRWWVKLAKEIVEFPFKIHYRHLKSKAFKHARKVVANSQFLAKEYRRKYGFKPQVLLPHIDVSQLNKKTMKANKQEYITFIGVGDGNKGYNIAQKIAKHMPDKRFLFIGGKRKMVVDNVTYLPFQKNVMDIYKLSKVLIVPSRWQEAYGRVVVEANYLGIPTITSNRGGLPEANTNKDHILTTFKTQEWVRKIREVL